MSFFGGIRDKLGRIVKIWRTDKAPPKSKEKEVRKGGKHEREPRPQPKPQPSQMGELKISFNGRYRYDKVMYVLSENKGAPCHIKVSVNKDHLSAKDIEDIDLAIAQHDWPDSGPGLNPHSEEIYSFDKETGTKRLKRVGHWKYIREENAYATG